MLHAEHGFNASHLHRPRRGLARSATCIPPISAAIGALKGPLHGGANEGVIHMLQEIGSLDKVDAWVEEALAQKKKIMGIGHRVYKVLDPRAPHLKAMAIKLSEELGDAEVDPDERAHRRHHEGAQGAQRERRFLLGHRLLLARHPDGSCSRPSSPSRA